MPRTALNVSGLIFLLIAAAQLTRFLLAVEVEAGGMTVPVELSLVAGIVFLILALWMLVAARRT